MHAGVEKAVQQSYQPTMEEVDEEGGKDSASVFDGGVSMILWIKREIPEPRVSEMSSEQ